MFKIPLPELKEKIKLASYLTEIEINDRIKKKINELSGLISEEGAAYILANELGITLIEDTLRQKIKGIYPGMRGFEVVGKVISKSEVREFEREGKKGKVANFQIGDSTGSIRVVCWHEQTDLLGKIKEGDILLLKSVYAKENNFSQTEIHLNERCEIEINPEGEDLPEVKTRPVYPRKKINELKDGEADIEVLGTVVQVFDPRFFNVCKTCNKRVAEKEGGQYCPEHGETETETSYVLNLIFDDGSSNIRTVFWKNQTNHLLGKTEEEMLRFKENPSFFDDLKTDLLGEQFRIVGRVNHNLLFDRLEFIAQSVFKAVASEEIERLEKK